MVWVGNPPLPAQAGASVSHFAIMREWSKHGVD